jgi:hypothetical protein
MFSSINITVETMEEKPKLGAGFFMVKTGSDEIFSQLQELSNKN